MEENRTSLTDEEIRTSVADDIRSETMDADMDDVDTEGDNSDADADDADDS